MNRLWLVLIGAVAAAAAVVLVIVLSGDDSPRVKTGVPREVSEGELRSFAGSVGHPVYWAGPVPGFKLELTKTSNGNVFVRYLPAAVPIGDRKPAYTTIATYPRKGAYAAALQAARGKGQVKKDAPGGGVAIYNTRRPTSVYLVYPGSDFLIEVFAAARQEAQQLATSGRVAALK